MKNFSIKFVLLMLTFVNFQQGFTSFLEACPNFSDKNPNLDPTYGLTWSIKKLFEDGYYLKKGSFGEVRKSFVSQLKNSMVAVKMVNLSEVNLKELTVMKILSESPHSPKFFGCQTFKWQAFIAQELLWKDFDSDTLKMKIRAEMRSESLQMYRMMFDALRAMWNLGYVHNDVKPANMMMDRQLKNVYLIDYGLVKERTAAIGLRGTPYFISPDKYKRFRSALQKDDMYALALSIAVMEAENGYDSIFKDYKNVKAVEIPVSCFMIESSTACRLILAKNVRRVLERVGYGEIKTAPENVKMSLMSFPNLLAAMVEFDNFNLDYEQVINNIDQLIKLEQTKENTWKNEARENPRANLPNIGKIDRELALSLQKTIFDLQNQENEAEKRMIALAVGNDQNQKKLEEQKNNNLRNGELDNLKQSQLYQFNPQLFNQMTQAQQGEYFTRGEIGKIESPTNLGKQGNQNGQLKNNQENRKSGDANLLGVPVNKNQNIRNDRIRGDNNYGNDKGVNNQGMIRGAPLKNELKNINGNEKKKPSVNYREDHLHKNQILENEKIAFKSESNKLEQQGPSGQNNEEKRENKLPAKELSWQERIDAIVLRREQQNQSNNNSLMSTYQKKLRENLTEEDLKNENKLNALIFGNDHVEKSAKKYVSRRKLGLEIKGKDIF